MPFNSQRRNPAERDRVDEGSLASERIGLDRPGLAQIELGQLELAQMLWEKWAAAKSGKDCMPASRSVAVRTSASLRFWAREDRTRGVSRQGSLVQVHHWGTDRSIRLDFAEFQWFLADRVPVSNDNRWPTKSGSELVLCVTSRLPQKQLTRDGTEINRGTQDE